MTTTSRVPEGLGRGRCSRGKTKMLSAHLNVDEDVLTKQCSFIVKIKEQSNHFIMSSFHEVQDQLLLSYEDGILDEDEFLLLHKQFIPKNLNFSYKEYDRFSSRV